MAVVQISRIQIRRGQKNAGTGIPQLASGEMAWAIDTQELYIGNGAISEGSPAVGNTKILTDADNLLDLIGQYVYKSDSALIQTGQDPNYPITRTLQERLDERVTSASYGILPNAGDQATAIQRAIDNLFITNTVNGAGDRVTLEFAPGVYQFSTTIYIPSYATILGAGKQKTIFNFTGPVGTAFAFVDDTSTPTNKVFAVFALIDWNLGNSEILMVLIFYPIRSSAPVSEINISPFSVPSSAKYCVPTGPMICTLLYKEVIVLLTEIYPFAPLVNGPLKLTEV